MRASKLIIIFPSKLLPWKIPIKKTLTDFLCRQILKNTSAARDVKYDRLAIF